MAEEVRDKEFYGQEKLIKIKITEGIKRVGWYAFALCKNLKEVIFEGVKYIAESAFAGCKRVERVEVDTIENWLGTRFEEMDSNPIGEETSFFVGGKEVKELVLPSVEEIGRNAFSNFAKLEKITLPSSLKRIGENAFRGCLGLEVLSLPKVEEIGKNAVVECGVKCVEMSDLESWLSIRRGYRAIDLNRCELIVGGEKIEKVRIDRDRVEDYTFFGYDSLKEANLVGVREVGEGAFEGCSSLKEVTFEKIVKIGKRAFAGSGVEKISLPYGTEEVEDFAFAHCPNLKEIVLPETIRRFSPTAFFGTKVKIYFRYDYVPTWKSMDFLNELPKLSK